jgi:hypothetical protein
MAVGHGALEAAGRLLARHGEWTLTGADFDTIELAYAAGALLLGGLAAVVPAWLAARTPLAGALADD